MLDPKYIPLFIGGFIAWICFMIFVGWITSRGKNEVRRRRCRRVEEQGNVPDDDQAGRRGEECQENRLEEKEDQSHILS